MNKYSLWVCALLFACNQNKSEHGHPHSADDRTQENTISITRWTENIELFAKFSPLVVGQVSSFSTHITLLEGYQPLESGKVTVSLIQDQIGLRQSVDKPIRAGLFIPAIKPTQTGLHTLIFDIESEGLMEKIIIPGMEVFNSLTDFNPLKLKEGDIEFTKEQAWNTDFSVYKVARRKIAQYIHSSGEVILAKGDIVKISAPAAGLVLFKKNLQAGQFVNKGDWLFTISGKGIVGGVSAEESLSSLYQNNRARLLRAESELKRQRRLFEDKIISASEFEDFKLDYEVAKTEFEEISQNYLEGGKKIISPTSGYIRELFVNPGEYVEVGHPLAETSSNTRLQLKLDIPTNHQHNIKNIKHLRVRSLLGWQELPGEITSYEQYIEDGNAFISAYYSTSYSHLTPGSFIEIEAAFGSDQERLAIPTSALLEDFGIYTVMVQKTGESFESREIKTAIKNSEWTEVVHGLKENERIVSIGAYQVKMASMKGEAPEHGHIH